MILESVYYFILRFLPEVEAANIYQGYENQNPLPKRQSFCIISLNAPTRVGTDVEEINEAGHSVVKKLMRYSVDVDFIGTDNEDARRKASVIELLGNSAPGIAYFRDNTGMRLLYADNMAYLPYVYESNQWCHRYRVTLHLDCWEKYEQCAEYVDACGLTPKALNLRVENIDAHHEVEE